MENYYGIYGSVVIFFNIMGEGTIGNWEWGMGNCELWVFFLHYRYEKINLEIFKALL